MSVAMLPITVESLFTQAKGLSDHDREELARRLYDSLPPIPEPPVVWESEEEAEAAWQAELNLRLEEVASGKAELIDGKEVFADLRARLREKRGA
jgi:putative addiction module component (TIGR02574 family)